MQRLPGCHVPFGPIRGRPIASLGAGTLPRRAPGFSTFTRLPRRCPSRDECRSNAVGFPASTWRWQQSTRRECPQYRQLHWRPSIARTAQHPRACKGTVPAHPRCVKMRHLLALMFAALPTTIAVAQPMPPCAAEPIPAYGETGGAPRAGIWTADELRAARWTPAACLGWSGDTKLVAAVTSRSKPETTYSTAREMFPPGQASGTGQ
jgi:hypothetical protein